MLFFNPPRKRKGRAVKRKRKRRTLAGAALVAHQRKVSKRTRRRRSRRSVHAASAAGGVMAKRRKRRGRRRARTNPPVARKRRRRATITARRRRRRGGYRRNPGFSVRGLVGQLKEGAQGAAGVLVGKAATNLVASRVPLPQDGIAGLAVKAGIGLAIGYGASRVAGAKFGQYVLIGALLGPVETAVRMLNIPVLNQALGDDFTEIAGVGAYPELGGVGSYPALGAGDEMDPFAASGGSF